MSTRKSTAQRAEKKTQEIISPPPLSTLSAEKIAALNFILWVLRDYNDDLDENAGSVIGMDNWFKEYTKSAKWVTCTDAEKDKVFKIYENINYVLTICSEQGDILFPDGARSELIAIPE